MQSATVLCLTRLNRHIVLCNVKLSTSELGLEITEGSIDTEKDKRSLPGGREELIHFPNEVGMGRYV